ncbi:MAG: alpha/beta hydrolase [Bacilli bacterium]|nr:alpha/beta hydrolase [Bacilli bacterium]
MVYKKILLKEIDPRFTDESLSLSIYISDSNEAVNKRPGMLVCPGGGYAHCSPRESEPVAFRFLSEGFNCFILNYSVKKKYPAPYLDLALAVSYIRNHEEEFNLFPNSLSIVGFSAGGHLVDSFGFLYPELAKEIGVNEELLRPFSIVSCYAVTLMGMKTHGGTRDVICEGDIELEKKLDVPSNVTNLYPPTFIWTTKDDGAVPYVNSTLFAEKLKELGVKHELYVFESGWHGSSVCNRSCYKKEDITEKMKDIRDWASLAADFIFDLFDSQSH